MASPGQAIQRWTARVAQAEHARGFVEGLTGGVVAGPAQDLEVAVAGHPDQVGVRPAHDQRQQRGLQIALGQKRRVDVAPEMVDPRQRFVPGRRQAGGQTGADQPRVTASRSMSSGLAQVLSRAASTSPGSCRRWARAATSGTTPPKPACSASWEAIRLTSTSRPRTRATDDSSQLDSMPRVVGEGLAPPWRVKTAPTPRA